MSNNDEVNNEEPSSGSGDPKETRDARIGEARDNHKAKLRGDFEKINEDSSERSPVDADIIDNCKYKDQEERKTVTSKDIEDGKDRMSDEVRVDKILKALGLDKSVSTATIDLFTKNKYYKACGHYIDWTRVKVTNDGRTFIFDCGECTNRYVVQLGSPQYEADFAAMEYLVHRMDEQNREYKINSTIMNAQIKSLIADRESLAAQALPQLNSIKDFLTLKSANAFWKIVWPVALGGIIAAVVWKGLSVL